MSIVYEPETPQTAITERVIINGKDVGMVKPYKDKWQAALNFAKCNYNPSMYSSGFGLTKEDAINDAIKNASSQVELMLEELAAIKAEMERGDA